MGDGRAVLGADAPSRRRRAMLRTTEISSRAVEANSNRTTVMYTAAPAMRATGNTTMCGRPIVTSKWLRGSPTATRAAAAANPGPASNRSRRVLTPSKGRTW
jgi:hypothetical protein